MSGETGMFCCDNKRNGNARPVNDGFGIPILDLEPKWRQVVVSVCMHIYYNTFYLTNLTYPINKKDTPAPGMGGLDTLPLSLPQISGISLKDLPTINMHYIRKKRPRVVLLASRLWVGGACTGTPTTKLPTYGQPH